MFVYVVVYVGYIMHSNRLCCIRTASLYFISNVSLMFWGHLTLFLCWANRDRYKRHQGRNRGLVCWTMIAASNVFYFFIKLTTTKWRSYYFLEEMLWNFLCSRLFTQHFYPAFPRISRKNDFSLAKLVRILMFVTNGCL